MHHPDIADIILTIDDYFLLSNDIHSMCRVEAISDDTDEYQPKHGIRISRQLKFGSIVAIIWDMNQDDDTVMFQHSRTLSSGTWTTDFTIECSDYCKESVRSVVRKIMTLDKQQAATNHQFSNPKDDDVVLSPNNKPKA